ALTGPAAESVNEALEVFGLAEVTLAEYICERGCDELLASLEMMDEKAQKMGVNTGCGEDCRRLVDAYWAWKEIMRHDQPEAVREARNATTHQINIFYCG
ncbi:unnamed protein product, partial [marine sediment metagenome]